MNNDIAIKVENVSKVYPLRQAQADENGNFVQEHWALKNVSFEIKKGESVGIIGPNGSGKSTLLKILAGVTKPTSGKITIKGKVASILDIGAGFHPELSGRENVFLNGQIHGFSKKEIEAKFDEIVAFSGIEKFIDEPVKNYSNGMYLRLAFSIMVHLDFDVYLLDEVLSVGDAEFRRKSQQRLYQLHSFQKKTIISVSHYMWEMAGANRIFHICKGEMETEASKEEVIQRYSSANYSELMINNPFFVNKYQYGKSHPCVEQITVYLKNKRDQFKSNEAITFITDFHNVKEKFSFAIVIHDRFNHPVIEISPVFNDITLFPGESKRLLTTFPPHFFNANRFSANILLFDSTSGRVIYFEEDICSFVVEIEDSYIGTMFEKTWGAIRPFMNWQTAALDN